MAQAERHAPVGRPGRERNELPEDDLAGRRRAAIELIRNHDRQLRSSARRYSICAEDADDAYQRGIEILLSKAPTTDLRQLLPWTRTVIKHESLAVRKQRERILGRPSSARDEDEGEDWIDLIPAGTEGPDERVVKREKVARSREALSRLKPQELKALTMLAEGYSYAEIGSINKWTRTKVNRCLAEGRQAFRSNFRESEAGERCESFQPMISASCDGEIGAVDLEMLEIHLAACGHCRATLKAYRAAPRAAAALLPAVPFSGSILERAQEMFVSLQARFNGIGGGSDSAATTVVVGGGTRGAGAAALAKIAALCAGAAGGAACIATGVLPGPALIPREDPDRPPSRPAVERAAPVAVDTPATTQDESFRPRPAASGSTGPSKKEAKSERNRRSATPEPTPTETEFTPEAAGTPVQAAPQTYSPPAASSASGAAPPPPSVPVGGGGGEFGP